MNDDISHLDGDFTIIRNGGVQVEGTRNGKNNPVVSATFADQFTHTFDAKSRISRALETMSPRELAERLTGGTFFFGPNGELIDFRDGNYHGFVHTDESINRLLAVIGHETHDNGNHRSLRKVWSESGIEVPEYATGGDFNSRLSFKWNPFHTHINSAFELVRLICSNGMTGLTSFLNTKVPLINRWEEHLDIANTQIQNKVNGIVTARLGHMGLERATIAECQQVADHAHNRLKDGNAVDGAARSRLQSIGMIAAPERHLGDVYRDNVFNDRRLGAQMPAHLNTFDVYNMATEVRSHTEETSSSTGHALDKMANALIFDRQDLTAHAARFGAPTLSSFSDSERAFFGEVEDDE